MPQTGYFRARVLLAPTPLQARAKHADNSTPVLGREAGEERRAGSARDVGVTKTGFPRVDPLGMQAGRRASH